MRGLLSRCSILTGLVIFIMSLSYFPGVPLPAFGLDVIIDNNTSESSETGKWSGSGGINYYGTTSEWSKAIGSTYIFETSFPGETMELEVYEYHTYYSSRCTNTQHLITDAVGTKATVPVNQKDRNARFNKLGTWTFTDYARVMIIVQSSDCSQNADAIRFMTPTQPPTVCPCFNTAEILSTTNDTPSWDYEEYKFGNNDDGWELMSVIIGEEISEGTPKHEYTVLRSDEGDEFNYCFEQRYDFYTGQGYTIDYYEELTDEEVDKCEQAILESGAWLQFQ